jgi:hypothetical protein
MVGNEMTALETLQKYGLKTDVKSIRERLYNPDNYFLELKITFSNTIDGTIKAINAEDIVHDADLSLLCEMAEKGERYEKAVKEQLEIAQKKAKEFDDNMFPSNFFWTYQGAVNALEKIIKESEGDPK